MTLFFFCVNVRSVHYSTASVSQFNPYRSLPEPPIKPEGSKYRFVIKETLTNEEEAVVSRRKGGKEEQEENVSVDDNPPATTSHYDSRISK